MNVLHFHGVKAAFDPVTGELTISGGGVFPIEDAHEFNDWLNAQLRRFEKRRRAQYEERGMSDADLQERSRQSFARARAAQAPSHGENGQ